MEEKGSGRARGNPRYGSNKRSSRNNHNNWRRKKGEKNWMCAPGRGLLRDQRRKLLRGREIREKTFSAGETHGEVFPARSRGSVRIPREKLIPPIQGVDFT